MAGTKRDALLASAEKSLQKGKVDSALKDYLKVLEEAPGDINILNKVGDLYTRLNRNEEAIPYLTRIAEHFARDGFFLRGSRSTSASTGSTRRASTSTSGSRSCTPSRASRRTRRASTRSSPTTTPGTTTRSARSASTRRWCGSTRRTSSSTSSSRTSSRRRAEDRRAQGIHDRRRAPEGPRRAVDEAIQVYEKALQMAPDNVEVLRSFVPSSSRPRAPRRHASSSSARSRRRRARSPCSCSRPRPHSRTAT